MSVTDPKLIKKNQKIVQGIARVSNKSYHLKHSAIPLVCGKGKEDTGRGEINLEQAVHADSIWIICTNFPTYPYLKLCPIHTIFFGSSFCQKLSCNKIRLSFVFLIQEPIMNF